MSACTVNTGMIFTNCAEQRQEKKLTQAHFRPLCDGVFRAVPPTVNAKEFCGKILQQVPAAASIMPPHIMSPYARSVEACNL